MEALRQSQAWDNSNDGFEYVLSMVKGHGAGGMPVFKTNTDGEKLWEAYFINLPLPAMQHYNCNSCKSFIKKYGGLVTVKPNGELDPIFWVRQKNNDGFFSRSIEAMNKIVRSSKITGQFFDENKTLGIPENYSEKHKCDFNHFSSENTFRNSHCHGYHTANQKWADSRERLKMLVDAMFHGYDEKTARIASEVVGEFSSGEKTEALAKWFLGLYSKKKNINLIWLEISNAPDGWCHVRSSVLGALMDDIKSGMSLDTVKRRFEEKMDPLKYQRAQSAPSDSNIEEAEKIIKKLGFEKSLERRYATVDELETIWNPIVDAEFDDSVFGHLKSENKKEDHELGGIKKITWERFASDVMPTAEKIWFNTAPSEPFGAITAPVHSDAPCIMKWKNPFGWFVRTSTTMWGRLPSRSDWNCGIHVPVKTICNVPANWEESGSSYGWKALFFILDGCRDMNETSGSALFTEILTGELYSVRKTIEAFSKSKPLEIPSGDLACGIMVSDSGMSDGSSLTVLCNGVKKKYKIDRWN